MKVYVASSWRNEYQPIIVEVLRKAGHDTYDFRNPRDGDYGFAWSNIDPAWQSWDGKTYVKALTHPLAIAGFESDMNALRSCDACVLVLPCGRSAHLEAGYAAGAGKRVVFYLPSGEPVTPELMYSMGRIALSPHDIVRALESVHRHGTRDVRLPQAHVRAADADGDRCTRRFNQAFECGLALPCPYHDAKEAR